MSETQQGNPGNLKFRKKRFMRCLELIEHCYQRKGSVAIVDLGGTREYWNILSEKVLNEKNIRITIVNNESNTLLAAEKHFTYVAADACCMAEFADNSFDLVHSNSVIEHVGGWERMEAFAHEVRRLAPEYFVQTPNFWFPLEPHYMLPCYHWLPVYMQIRILGWKYRHQDFRESVMAQERIRLLSFKAFSTLFPDSVIYPERILIFTKSFVALRRM